MPITRRIYVSLPADPWLPKNLNDLKWGIVEEIEKLGFTPEIFTNPKGKPGLASPKAGTLVMRTKLPGAASALQSSECLVGPSRTLRDRRRSCPQNSTTMKAPSLTRWGYPHLCSSKKMFAAGSCLA